MMPSTFNLERFVEAQEPMFSQIRAELKAGTKRGHWMWFVFPQLRGLGRSSKAQFYGLESAAEALAYWRHPVLGPRLKSCVEWILAAPVGRTAHDIFGDPDDLKLRSCLTLFQHVATEEPIFGDALARFYNGQPDPQTRTMLAGPN